MNKGNIGNFFANNTHISTKALHLEKGRISRATTAVRVETICGINRRKVKVI